MKSKTFDNGLVVKHRRSAIILENASGKKEKEEMFEYHFTTDGFKEFADYIIEVANQAWKNITPKEATSFGSDYAEYYDKKYDANGNLRILDDGILIYAPYWSVDTLYQFNKAKVQSFIYDLNKRIKEQSQ